MPIQAGDTVAVQYVGTLDSGEEFDRSAPESPLVFQMGKGQLIPGFEAAVLGKDKGDAFTVTIPAEQAYGAHAPELLFQVPRGQVPSNLELVEGMPLHVATDQGELEVRVVGVDDSFVTLDANHPLAGQALTFAMSIEAVS